jgi:hypothetical protein
MKSIVKVTNILEIREISFPIKDWIAIGSPKFVDIEEMGQDSPCFRVIASNRKHRERYAPVLGLKQLYSLDNIPGIEAWQLVRIEIKETEKDMLPPTGTYLSIVPDRLFKSTEDSIDFGNDEYVEGSD